MLDVPQYDAEQQHLLDEIEHPEFYEIVQARTFADHGDHEERTAS